MCVSPPVSPSVPDSRRLFGLQVTQLGHSRVTALALMRLLRVGDARGASGNHPVPMPGWIPASRVPTPAPAGALRSPSCHQPIASTVGL